MFTVHLSGSIGPEIKPEKMGSPDAYVWGAIIIIAGGGFGFDIIAA